MAVHQNCPLEGESRQVRDLAEELARSLPRLRRTLAACRRCPLNREPETCALRREITTAVQTALDQLYTEWGWK